jgi:hypothetical protein
VITGTRESLLLRFDGTRQKIEELLPNIDPYKDIYLGWTIKQILMHITGWDDAAIDSLHDHIDGQAPSVPANRGIDEYNARTVASRQGQDFPRLLKEWRMKRKLLRAIIFEMPEDKFIEPFVLPWGGKGTVVYLVDTFRHHEEIHAQDIKQWLTQPEEPLGKAGN